MYRRELKASLLAALNDRPVVFLSGARQTGKTTLVRELATEVGSARYLTLDEIAILSAARADPAGFVAGLDTPVILDEVQRAPELFLPIKAAVDRDRRPGRFLLTGSADVLLLPRVSESLAGRMEILTLWPLSQGEIEGVPEGFLDAVFSAKLPGLPEPRVRWGEVVRRMAIGGYPEAQTQASASRRDAWFGSYVTAILQRDVRDLANIEGLTQMPRLLALLAARLSGLLNFSELSRTSGIPQSTLKRYMTLLETTFLLLLLSPWSGNLGKRFVKSPRIMLNDTGLAAHLLGVDAERLRADPGLAGHLLENFVFMELKKQVGWSRTRAQVFHFRTQAGQEVDFVLEDRSGRLVGIEVKASATVDGNDFRGLKSLAEDSGERFVRGVLLYAGKEVIPFGRQLHALPLDALWRLGASHRPAGETTGT